MKRPRPETIALTVAGVCAAVLLVGGPIGLLPQAHGTDRHHDSHPTHHHPVGRHGR